MSSIMQVQVKSRGRLTLPKAWRQENHIEPGDVITLTRLENGTILLHAHPSRAGRLVNKIAGELRKAGVTLADMLEELQHIRK